ncbi:nucleotide exchange factor GrpE [Thermodesulfobacteriota bacterium]
MTTKKDDDAVKIEISQEETETGGEKNEAEDKGSSQMKSPEKMSKKELLKKVEELMDESAKNYDQFLRSKAEMDNLIKRNKKEKEDWVKYSNETLVKEILPAMDNLEMAISHSDNESSFQALKEGVELTLKGLKDSLAKSGLLEVKAKGEPFDPCFHHAVSQQDSESIEAGFIMEELQKGYILNERLIRPSMVVLSRGKPGEGSTEKTPENVCEEKL